MCGVGMRAALRRVGVVEAKGRMGKLDATGMTGS